ncbi:MAG: hypothetical protein KC547_17020 [Anaerolineae bacterium]|nr:hypothetical protein [Anaerolineae bacterium]
MFRRIIGAVFVIALSTTWHPAVAQGSTVQCGDIVEGVFTQNEQVNQYTISMRSGEVLQPKAVAFGDFLQMVLAIRSPAGDVLVNSVGDTNSAANRVSWGYSSPDPSAHSGVLSASGEYSIEIASANRNGVGEYTLSITCTSRDGTLIEPGTLQSTETADNSSRPPSSEAASFSGFGLPVVGPVDFSVGIEIPLLAGQVQVAPIGGDVALYTYQASAGSTSMLSVSRVSGDISVGVAVINRDTNEIIFLGGMPHSDQLSVLLTFPSDGTYAIGLFRLDTPTIAGTSGAVQISISE